MKFSILALAAAALCVSCSGQPGATTPIKGEFTSMIPETVHFEVAGVDTTVAVTDGKFSLELPTTLVEYATATLGQLSATFVADGTPLSFKIDSVVTIKSASPKYSIQDKLDRHIEWARAFSAEYRAQALAIRNDETLSRQEAEAKFEPIYDSLMNAYSAHAAELLKGNEANVLAVEAIRGLVESDTDSEIISQALETVDQSVKDKEPFLQKMEAALAAKVNTAEGKMFTDFTIVQNPEDPEHSTVHFSDYVGRGKYVLVDFWASWCGPCKGEIPNIKAVYEKYHGEDFDVLSIAVWDKVENTIATAKELGVCWNEIVNAQNIPTDLYGIQGIPHIMLVGPDGIILKRDLRGEGIAEEVSKYVQAKN